jgi:hypothetical protein
MNSRVTVELNIFAGKRPTARGKGAKWTAGFQRDMQSDRTARENDQTPMTND